MSKVFTVIFEGNQPSITSTIGFDQHPAKIIAVYAGDRIEKLEAQLAQSQLKRWAARWEEQADRIEKLEAALREIDIACDYSGAEYVCRGIARKALEKKDE